MQQYESCGVWFKDVHCEPSIFGYDAFTNSRSDSSGFVVVLRLHSLDNLRDHYGWKRELDSSASLHLYSHDVKPEDLLQEKRT